MSGRFGVDKIIQTPSVGYKVELNLVFVGRSVVF